MADLDAELLALAGDDSGSEEGSISPPARQQSSSPRESPEPDMARKGIAKPVKKSGARAKPTKRRKSYSSSEQDA